MSKEILTEEKAKKNPSGGVLVGKRQGQTIIHDKGTAGGYLVGKLHKEGGIKGVNKATGQPIEVQGGEVIITAPAVADQTKREFEGEMLTNREILSRINEKGGGVSFANGGDIPKEVYYNGSSYNFGGKTMSDYEIMQEINNCGCEYVFEDGSGIKKQEKGGKIKTYKQKYNKKYGYPENESHDLEEISKDTGVSLKGLQQIYNKGIGAYKTNPESVRPNVKSKEQWAMARVYSAVMGGKASEVDVNELKMSSGGSMGDGVSLGYSLEVNSPNLDFLDEIDQVFESGGQTKEPIEFIEIEKAGNGIDQSGGSIINRRYYSFDEFLKDIQDGIIKVNNMYRKSYITLNVNGKSFNDTIFSISLTNGRNSKVSMSTKSSNYNFFKQQISWKRVYKNYDFDAWANKKSTPTPAPEPKKVDKIEHIAFSLKDIAENKIIDGFIASDDYELENIFKKIQEIFKQRNFKEIILTISILIEREKSQLDIGVLITTKPTNKLSFNILNINYQEFVGLIKTVWFEYEALNSDDFDVKSWGKNTIDINEINKRKFEFYDFEATRKFLNQRINDLSKEIVLKTPILSNEELGFLRRDLNTLIEKLRRNNELELNQLNFKDRLKMAYKVKFGDINNQYNPAERISLNGMPTILTEEEWNTTKGNNFKAWFGDWELANQTGNFAGVSKIIDPVTKEPLPVYHGTDVLFTNWKVYKTNNAHYFAKRREMSEWFARQWEEGRGDISARDSQTIKRLNPNRGAFLYRCFLDIKNPIDFSKFGVEKRPVKDFLIFLKINYNIGDYDFWSNFMLWNQLTQETPVYAWMIIRNWQSFTEYIKLATTYDGYIFYEYIPQRPETGLENASLSFCAFESEQIKFTNATEFNSNILDSRFNYGGKI